MVVSGGLIRLFNCPNTAAVVLSPVAPLVPNDPLPSRCPYTIPNCTEADALLAGSYL